jgi:hypothetical protein
VGRISRNGKGRPDAYKVKSTKDGILKAHLRSPMKKPLQTTDPLLQLFEHFLTTRSYESSAQFTKQLAENYLVYLDSTMAHMPFEARQLVLEDLASEAHEMLVKRMYGCRTTAEVSGQVFQFRDGKVVNPSPLNMPEVPANPKPE